MQSIVVVGGGYAGVLGSLRAARRARGRAKVVLVSDSEGLVERIRLHERAARGRVVVVPYGKLLRGTGVELVRAHVTRIEPEARLVHTDAGSLGYARLIACAGSRVDVDALPGVRAHAYTLSPDDAERLGAAAARAAERRGRLVVVGGGLSGIEAAAEFAERHPALAVALVTAGEIGPQLSETGRSYLRAALARLHVELEERTTLMAIDARGVVSAGGVRRADVVVWAGGFVAAPLLRDAGLAVDERGRAWVNPMLRALGRDDVFCAGDAARPVVAPGSAIFMGCKTAMPMAAQAAENATAELRGAPLRAFDFRDGGYCISLGRSDGMIQLMQSDGAPAERVLRGRLAAFLKELVCRYTLFSLRAERLGLFEYRWFHTGRAPVALPPASETPLLPGATEA